jgi:hypothetical protein
MNGGDRHQNPGALTVSFSLLPKRTINVPLVLFGAGMTELDFQPVPEFIRAKGKFLR